MAKSNVIVTKTVNKTTFEADKSSYDKVIRQIKQVGKEWDKASGTISRPKKDPAKAYGRSASQIQLVNKRLAQTRMREEKRQVDYSIAMAKKEARAKQAVAKISAARIRQQMATITAKNPALSDMKKFYQQQERAARAANRAGAQGGAGSSGRGRMGRLRIRRAFSLQGGQTGDSSNIRRSGPYSPAEVSRQNAEMIRHHRRSLPPQADPAKEKEKQRAAAIAARRDDILSQQRIRLSSRYGNNYGSALGKNKSGEGIHDLNNQFKSGALSAGQYRQSIQALERQFRTAQSSAGGFGSSLRDLRSTLMSAGAAYGVFSAGKSVLQQGQFFQGLDATMSMVSDSSDEAGKRIQFVKDQSYRLGLSLKEASQGYVQMSVASNGIISKQENDDLFKSFSEYSTALQVDPVKYQRGITAIGQMMGKGQVMAEELKGQLAEGIPGSLQVFVKAAQEAFKDTTIDVEKLMDMMQAGQLKASKILPYVGKYFAEAARKGGALEKAMNSNRVAMQRMQQTWVNFQNSIFEGGFGDQMTKVFQDIASMLNSNGELATNLGSFFGNMIEGFWDMVLEIHDDFVLLDRVFSYYAQKFGVQGESLKKVFDWAGYALGIGIFIKSITTVLKILTKIAGLRGAIVAIRGAMGGDLAGGAGGSGGGGAGGSGVNGAGGSGGLHGPTRGGFNIIEGWKNLGAQGKVLGKIAKIGALGDIYALGSSFNDRFLKRGDDTIKDAGFNPENYPSQGFMPKPVGLMDVYDQWFSKSPRDLDRPTLGTSSLTTPSVPAPPQGVPFPNNNEQMEGKITIKVEAGELKNMVKAVVDENNRFNFNMLTQGGSSD